MKNIALAVLFICFVCETICQTTVNLNTPSGGYLINEDSVIFNKKVDGKKNGYWSKKWFFNGKRTKEVSFYSNGIKDGECFKFYYNGEIRIEGNYRNGKKNGVFVYYKKNIVNFKDGRVRTGHSSKLKLYESGKSVDY